MRIRHEDTEAESLHASETTSQSASISMRPAPFAVGRIIGGKYRIEQELAEGGLGVIVVATHVELGQKVAIKYLKPNVLADASLVARFRREAQLAASIRSDHVVRVFDVGTAEEAGPYMVMEYLEGEDLGSVLSRGPVAVERAIDFVVQACDALAEAHAMGIVHRDLKPENLFVANRKGAAPIIKILDFGISKVNEARRAIEGAPRARQLTEAGERFGTPVYMSPEQLRDTGTVDSRTDIWALGVVLFELLTADLPFTGQTVPEVTANILRDPPVLLRVKRAGAGDLLEAVISKCLEKDPAMRYRNVGELVQELVSFAAPNSEPRTGRIRRVILEGGDSIRPPRPIATPATPWEPKPAGTAPLSERTSGPTLDQVEIDEPSPRARRAGVWIPVVAGFFVVALVVTVAALYATKKATVVTATPTDTVAQELPARSPPPSRDTVVSSPTVTDVVVKPVAPSSSTVVAAPRAPSATSAATSVPATPITPVTPPKKPTSDYDQFGERR